MIEFLFALINDPAMSFMLGLSLGFFVRHTIANNDEKLAKKTLESIIKESNKDIQ